MSATDKGKLAARRGNVRRSSVLRALLRYAVVAGALVVTLLPVAWIFLTSIKGPDEWVHDPPVWIPSSPSFISYVAMWNGGGGRALMNSAITVVSSTALALIIGCPAAYSIARFAVGGQNFANWILSVKFLPPIVFAVPIIVVFRTIGLIDTYWALIITYTTFNLPFVVWLMKGFFDEIPYELDEAALIDGCSRFGTFIHIGLPLAAPGLVPTALLTFIFGWSEYLFALVLTQSKLFTVPVQLSNYFGDGKGLEWGPQAALSSVAIVPIIVLALTIQRYLIRGMTFGAVKG